MALFIFFYFFILGHQFQQASKWYESKVDSCKIYFLVVVFFILHIWLNLFLKIFENTNNLIVLLNVIFCKSQNAHSFFILHSTILYSKMYKIVLCNMKNEYAFWAYICVCVCVCFLLLFIYFFLKIVNIRWNWSLYIKYVGQCLL